MSLTTQSPTLTVTAVASAITTDALGRPLIPPDAIRFFVIAATVCIFFGSTTCACCIAYRIRKARMRRVVIAAFQEGVLDRETIFERMAYIHRMNPTFNHVFPGSDTGIPTYFDKVGGPTGTLKVDWETNVEQVKSPGNTPFLPLSAQVQVPSGTESEPHAHPYLSSLPLEKQLALLFHASRTRGERERRKAIRRQLNILAPREMEHEPKLVLSVLVKMPRAGGGGGDLALGTTAFPWSYKVAEPMSQTTAAATSDGDAALAPTRG